MKKVYDERIEQMGKDPEMEREHINRYKFASHYVKNKNVLDIACGIGYGSKILADAGCKLCTGGDVDENSLEKAKLTYKDKNLKFKKMDAQKIPLSKNSVDVVVSFETIEHIDKPKEHLSSVVKVLNKDGVYICSTPVRKKGSLKDKPNNPFHVREWNLVEFNRLLRDYFGQVELLGQSFYFKKTTIPFGRTILNILCKLLFSKEYSKINKTNVGRFPKLLKGMKCLPENQILVCRNPLK